MATNGFVIVRVVIIEVILGLSGLARNVCLVMISNFNGINLENFLSFVRVRSTNNSEDHLTILFLGFVIGLSGNHEQITIGPMFFGVTRAPSFGVEFICDIKVDIGNVIDADIYFLHVAFQNFAIKQIEVNNMLIAEFLQVIEPIGECSVINFHVTQSIAHRIQIGFVVDTQDCTGIFITLINDVPLLLLRACVHNKRRPFAICKIDKITGFRKHPKRLLNTVCSNGCTNIMNFIAADVVVMHDVKQLLSDKSVVKPMLAPDEDQGSIVIEVIEIRRVARIPYFDQINGFDIQRVVILNVINFNGHFRRFLRRLILCGTIFAIITGFIVQHPKMRHDCEIECLITNHAFQNVIDTCDRIIESGGINHVHPIVVARIGDALSDLGKHCVDFDNGRAVFGIFVTENSRNCAVIFLLSDDDFVFVLFSHDVCTSIYKKYPDTSCIYLTSIVIIYK